MPDMGERTDIYDSSARRSSAGTVILILLGIAVLGAVGYDVYSRTQTKQQAAQQVTQTAQANQQMQQQLQDAMARVTQSDQNAQTAEQEKVMWMSLARAAAGTVALKPPTLYSVQRAVFGSADPQTRQFLRDYFKKPENIEKVQPIVVYVAGLVQLGPMMRTFLKSCEPLFMGPLPETDPTNPDALWCYEFLKRRQAEGGDLASWQKLLAATATALETKS